VFGSKKIMMGLVVALLSSNVCALTASEKTKNIDDWLEIPSFKERWKVIHDVIIYGSIVGVEKKDNNSILLLKVYSSHKGEFLKDQIIKVINKGRDRYNIGEFHLYYIHKDGDAIFWVDNNSRITPAYLIRAETAFYMEPHSKGMRIDMSGQTALECRSYLDALTQQSPALITRMSGTLLHAIQTPIQNSCQLIFENKDKKFSGRFGLDNSRQCPHDIGKHYLIYVSSVQKDLEKQFSNYDIAAMCESRITE